MDERRADDGHAATPQCRAWLATLARQGVFPDADEVTGFADGLARLAIMSARLRRRSTSSVEYLDRVSSL